MPERLRQRCRSRCERQRPGRRRAWCRWERVEAVPSSSRGCSASAIAHCSLPSRLRSPIPLGVTAVTPAQPLRDTGHPWPTRLLVRHAKTGEVFLTGQSGNVGLVLWGCCGWKSSSKPFPPAWQRRWRWWHLAVQLVTASSPACPLLLPRPSRGSEMGLSTHHPPVQLPRARSPLQTQGSPAHLKVSSPGGWETPDPILRGTVTPRS